MIYVLLFCFTIITSLDYKDAMELNWPFRVDYIFLEFRQQFLNGSPKNVNPGIHQILYIEELPFTPNKILITTSKYWKIDGNLIVKYSYMAQSISKTGFTLVSDFNATLHDIVLLSYLTIVENYGIQLLFTNTLISASVASGGNRAYKYSVITTLNLDPLNSSNNFIVSFSPQLYISNISKSDAFVVTTNFLFQTVEITITLPSTAKLQSITLSVFIRSLPTFLSTTSSFLSYKFDCNFVSGPDSQISIFFNNNSTSTVYFLGGLVYGRINNDFSLGHWILTVPYFDLPIFNAEYLKNRNNGSNDIASFLFDAGNYDNSFAYIWIQRINCNDLNYPYLMMSTQRCYKLCPSKYYNDSNGRCNLCSSCSNIANCDYCYYSMCAYGFYYNHSNSVCKKCNTISNYCLECLKGKCTVCDNVTNIILDNGLCIYKVITPVDPDPEQQQPDEDQQEDSQLEEQQQEPQPEEQQEKELPSPPPISFQLMYQIPHSKWNSIYGYIIFDTNLSDIQNNFQLKWFLNNKLYNTTLVYFYDNNTIRAQLNVMQSFDEPILKVQILSQNPQFFQKIEQQITIDDIEFIHPAQQELSNILQQITGGISDHSGIILSSSSLTSVSGYLIGILWNLQIASYYLFLPVYKPKNLQNILNSTIQILNIDILPFSIPSPLDDDQTKIQGDQIYDDYDIDLYFMKSNFQDIMSLIVFSAFYYVLYLIFRQFKPKRFLSKYIKIKIVDQVYANISMNFYSLITVMAFTASSALTSRRYLNLEILTNNFTASAGLFLTFFFSMLHPIILYIKKQKQKQDTQDCYLGLNRQKKYSQVVLVMILMFQLLIPISIPLFHPMFTIGIITILTILNGVCLVKRRPTKVRISIYYRLVSQFCFIIFNLTFIVYYLKEHYFKKISINIMSSIGYLSIGAMLAVVILEMIEMITEMILDMTEFIKKLCSKKIIKDNEIIRKEKIISYNTDIGIINFKPKDIKMKRTPNLIQNKKISEDNSKKENKQMYTKYGNRLRSKRDHTMKMKFDNNARRRTKQKKNVQFPEDLVFHNFSQNLEILYHKNVQRLKSNALQNSSLNIDSTMVLDENKSKSKKHSHKKNRKSDHLKKHSRVQNDESERIKRYHTMEES